MTTFFAILTGSGVAHCILLNPILFLKSLLAGIAGAFIAGLIFHMHIQFIHTIKNGVAAVQDALNEEDRVDSLKKSLQMNDIAKYQNLKEYVEYGKKINVKQYYFQDRNKKWQQQKKYKVRPILHPKAEYQKLGDWWHEALKWDKEAIEEFKNITKELKGAK